MNRDDLAPEVRDRLERFSSHHGVLPLPPPEGAVDLGSITSQHTAAVAAIARVDALATTFGSLFLISRLLVRREAVTSSAIEGTHSTLDELLRGEEAGDDTSSQDAKQVRDYAVLLGRYVDLARERRASIFTLDLVRDLHARLMREDKSYRDVAGELRSRVVWIGGRGGSIAASTWNPPPPTDVEACLRHTLDYMRNEGMQRMTQSIVTRMAVAHAHFEAVHPFVDGNGRLGRLLMPLMMAAEGHTPLYLGAHLEARQGRYFGALKSAQQQGDWATMVAFLCEAIIGTARHLEETVAMIDALRDQWLTRRTFRRGSAALRALDVLVRFPIITVTRLSVELGVSFPQASAAIDQLSGVGIVQERTGYRRNRMFAADDVLEIMNRPYD